MIALFFEVTPRPGQEDRYLEIAGDLKPSLETSGGHLYLNRYRSLSRPRTMLSHQLWQDEASLARWRANGRHYGAQALGRREVFEDYRLRVGAIVATVTQGETPGPAGAHPAPLLGPAYNDPVRRPERYMAMLYATAEIGSGPAGREAWRSVYNDAEMAITADAADRQTGLELIDAAIRAPCVRQAHLVLVSRDYGMYERHEAPQYFPPASSA